jgi:hypothetical protein
VLASNGQVHDGHEPQMAPIIRLPRPGGLQLQAHSVQFYEDDAFLLDGLSRFVGSALGAGDAAIVITTQAHRTGLAQRMEARGLDVAQAVAEDRYLALDAAETLATFMVDGWPEPGRFETAIGDVIGRAAAAADQPRVAAFGEMVALLWAEGNADAAIRLEQLWNDLAQRYPFYLHCAYPMRLFAQYGDARRIADVCAIHRHVMPTEGYTELTTDDERLRTITLLQQKAQALETEVQEKNRLLPNMFEPFERGRNVVGRIDGTGIGLAGARHIVERLGGTISVVSQEGKGSTFSVRLPLSGPVERAEDERARTPGG